MVSQELDIEGAAKRLTSGAVKVSVLGREFNTLVEAEENCGIQVNSFYQNYYNLRKKRLVTEADLIFYARADWVIEDFADFLSQDADEMKSIRDECHLDAGVVFELFKENTDELFGVIYPRLIDAFYSEQIPLEYINCMNIKRAKQTRSKILARIAAFNRDKFNDELIEKEARRNTPYNSEAFELRYSERQRVKEQGYEAFKRRIAQQKGAA
jgi:hypothetical protein